MQLRLLVLFFFIQPEINKSIKELKVNKAPDKDKITPKIINDLKEYIYKKKYI